MRRYRCAAEGTLVGEPGASGPVEPRGGAMGMLQRFESRLEQAVSGVFAKAFRSAVQPVELAAALQREVDNSAQILSRNRRLVPNTFAIELSAVDFERLQPYSHPLTEELVDM